MILGEKLKEYRKGRKISQEDLAEKLNEIGRASCRERV